MRATRSAAAAGAALAMLLLGGCGTSTAAGTTTAVSSAVAERPSAASSPTPAHVDEAALEHQVAKLASRSMPVTIHFLAPTRDMARGASTVGGHRLDDVMAAQGLDPLPADADVWVARVSTPTLGKLAHPDSRDGKISKRMFDDEVVWVLRYRHVPQGPVGGRSISDPLPSSPTATPSLWYSDMVWLIKPGGFVYAVTVG